MWLGIGIEYGISNNIMKTVTRFLPNLRSFLMQKREREKEELYVVTHLQSIVIHSSAII